MSTPHALLIGAQLEPLMPDAGLSDGKARMVITCHDCPNERWILSANVRTISDLTAMQEYHRAEHDLPDESEATVVELVPSWSTGWTTRTDDPHSHRPPLRRS